MASKKLATAIAQGKLVVRNVISGEVSIKIAGKTRTLSPNETLDIGKLLKNPREALKIQGLQDRLRDRHLVLE